MSMNQNYDDQAMIALEEQQVSELVASLINYAQGLETQVVGLRSQINRLSASDTAKPYPDLHSDIYELFCDYPAYERNKTNIEAFLENFQNR